MIFFALGKNEDEARERFIAEYGAAGNVEAYRDLITQIAASKPFDVKIKNNTFGLKVSIQANVA